MNMIYMEGKFLDLSDLDMLKLLKLAKKLTFMLFLFKYKKGEHLRGKWDLVFFKPLLLHVPYANPSIFCGRIFTDIWESRREAWRPPCKGYCYSINSDIFSIFDVATTQIDCMHPLWIKTILANGGNMRWRMVLCSLTWCFLNLFSLTWYFTNT